MTFKISLLREVLEQSMNDPALQPTTTKSGLITYCNLHCYKVAQKLGYPYFYNDKLARPMMANEQIAYIMEHPHLFSKIYSPTKASEMAQEGFLVFAAVKDTPHGHICPLSPNGDFVESGNWKCKVPICANVGKTNGWMGINFAFSKDNFPDFYVVL